MQSREPARPEAAAGRGLRQPLLPLRRDVVVADIVIFSLPEREQHEASTPARRRDGGRRAGCPERGSGRRFQGAPWPGSRRPATSADPPCRARWRWHAAGAPPAGRSRQRPARAAGKALPAARRKRPAPAPGSTTRAGAPAAQRIMASTMGRGVQTAPCPRRICGGRSRQKASPRGSPPCAMPRRRSARRARDGAGASRTRAHSGRVGGVSGAARVAAAAVPGSKGLRARAHLRRRADAFEH